MPTDGAMQPHGLASLLKSKKRLVGQVLKNKHCQLILLDFQSQEWASLDPADAQKGRTKSHAASELRDAIVGVGFDAADASVNAANIESRSLEDQPIVKRLRRDLERASARVQRLESQLEELLQQKWDAVAIATCGNLQSKAGDNSECFGLVRSPILPSAQKVAGMCRKLLTSVDTRLWVNLTAGVEVLPAMEPDLLPSLHFTRIRSTHCERAEWDALIRDLDNSLLFQLARGFRVVLVDCGSARDDGCSRALWQGLEFVRFVLSRRWLDHSTDACADGVNIHGADMTRHFASAEHNLSEVAKRKVDYYKKFAGPAREHGGGVRLHGLACPSHHDGDDGFYIRALDLVGLKAAAPSDKIAAASGSPFEALTATFAKLTPEATQLQPNDELTAAFAERGTGQWTYGEITLEGCRTLVDALLLLEGGEASSSSMQPEECTLLDVGSGVGQICLYAAAVVKVKRAIGIELVPSRHAVAEAAREAMRSQLDDGATSVELRCADALDATELSSFVDATHIFIANAVFGEALTSDLIRHVARHSSRLRALATLKEPPEEVLKAAGLVLVRATAVTVSWEHAFGWPLYVYRRQEDGAAAVEPPRVVRDEKFAAALESSDWFAMV